MNIAHIILGATTVICIAYYCWKLWVWHKEDEKLQRHDFIETLITLHLHQASLARAIQNNNEIQVSKSVTAIYDLIGRLELHKTDQILKTLNHEQSEKNN